MRTKITTSMVVLGSVLGLSACNTAPVEIEAVETVAVEVVEKVSPYAALHSSGDVSNWPQASIDMIDADIEARIDGIMAKMTDEQKVGQIIQADNSAVTPADVKKYRLGSVLSGGNSAPNGKPYGSVEDWVADVDAYYMASIDTEGVEIAVPIIWGIDAVHGHNNVTGGTIFPHNIGLGATRNPDLIGEIAAVTALELRVTGHDWTFAPTVAVPRDSRWGRSYEGFGEDPEIVASYSGKIVEGLQGKFGEDGFLGQDRVLSTAKHFVGDGGTLDGHDQGDAVVPEAEFARIHGAGYLPALEAGSLSVMASFSSWNGKKIHGDKYLLTDVLKDRMGFDGFVVGDWNAHGQIEGCTSENCPAALMAGLDMYMAPDSWKGLYENTLVQVKSGEIPMSRLDDAVRRILRAKIRYGLFEQVRPSEREFAGNSDLLGSPEHRDIARRAVRQSLVLLKNQNAILPINPALNVMVTGDGADSISKQAGGWTLTWQGGGMDNDEFPNGDSILDGIQEASNNVTYSEDGSYADKPDVAIVVFGEDPYAEFQGDVEHLAYDIDGSKELALLRQLQSDGIPVVSVFLSGRPMWLNREINASEAVVAAWLPGSEGAGIADVLFADDAGNARYDFSGTLSYSWPKTPDQTPLNVGDEGYDPLFAYGYGLSYAAPGDVPILDESGADGLISNIGHTTFFEAGAFVGDWTLQLSEDVQQLRIDHLAQEDAVSLVFTREGTKTASLGDSTIRNYLRETNAQLELSIMMKSAVDGRVEIGVLCDDETVCDDYITLDLPESEAGEWSDVRVSLSCFADANMSAITSPFSLRVTGQGDLAFSSVQLAEDADGAENCGK